MTKTFLEEMYENPPEEPAEIDDSWIHNEDLLCDMRREAIRMFLDLQDVPEEDARGFMGALDHPDSEELWVDLNELLTMDGTPFLELNGRELTDMKGRFLAHAFAKEANNPRPNPEMERIEEVLQLAREEVKQEHLIAEARRLMTLALDFWSAPGIDMPDIDTFDAMVTFLEKTGEPYKCKWDDDGNYIGEPTKPVGMTEEEFDEREAEPGE